MQSASFDNKATANSNYTAFFLNKNHPLGDIQLCNFAIYFKVSKNNAEVIGMLENNQDKKNEDLLNEETNNEVNENNEASVNSRDTDSSYLDLITMEDEDISEKNTLTTQRYEEEGIEVETQTVSLFVTARNTGVDGKPAITQNSTINPTYINSNQVSNQKRVEKPNKKSMSPLKLVIIIGIIGIVLIIGIVVIGVIGSVIEEASYENHNIADSDEDDEDNEEDEDEDFDEVAVAVVENSDWQDENLDVEEGFTNETQVDGGQDAVNTTEDKIQEEIFAAEDVILDTGYYDENTGMTIYYPSEWMLSIQDANNLLLENTRMDASIQISGIEITNSSLYEVHMTYEDFVVSAMEAHVSANMSWGTVNNYVDSIDVDEHKALMVADFDIVDKDGLTWYFHVEKLALSNYYLSMMTTARGEYYQETLATYSAIAGNIVLPSY